MSGAADSPAVLARDVLLRDGTIVTLQAVDTSDRDALVAFHLGLSDRSRYLRFFSSGAAAPAAYIRNLLDDLEAGQAYALMAVAGGRIAGLASCSRAAPSVGSNGHARSGSNGHANGRSVAEVAVAVADTKQHQGLGTVLLEHLAALAESHGITAFVADVLADNAAMVQVLQNSGFELAYDRQPGTLELRFPVHLTDRLVEASLARERVADAASVRRLLHPRSVVVVGASRRAGAPGRVVLQNLIDGFRGPVYAVNPNARTVAGLQAYPSALDLPEPVDLAVLAVPAAAVPEVARECAVAGVRDLVVLSSGFAEASAAGRDLQDRTLAIARQHGMRLVGPNCLGIANPDPQVGLNATFTDIPVRPGPVALMTQSGAVGIAALRQADELGIGLSAFVSAGNKADVSGNDLLMYGDLDDRTRVIGLYLESLGNPRKFARLVRDVGARKPVVTLVGGTSDAGRRAASSHTSRAITSKRALDALFDQSGVVATTSLEQFLHVLAVLSAQPLLAGPRVAIVGNGGGPGVLTADACAAEGLEVAALSADTRRSIRELAVDAAADRDPVDLGSGVSGEQFVAALELVARDPGVDAVVAVHTPVPALDSAGFVAAVEKSRERLAGSGVPLVAVMVGERAARPPIGDPDGGWSVPAFGYPEHAARALGPVARHVAWRGRDRGVRPEATGIDRDAARRYLRYHLVDNPDGRWLDLHESAHLLGCYGIDVAPTIRAMGAEAAMDAAAILGYPVVLKTADPMIVHRTERGGVRTGLTNADAVRRAYRQLVDERLSPDETGVFVQRHVAAGVEVFAGVAQDPAFGPLVVFGAGGTLTDLYDDRVVRLAPLTDAESAALVRRPAASALLFGYRGSRTSDVPALEDLLARLGRLAADLPQVTELDLNPVVVHPSGLAVVDAKIRIRPVGDALAAELPALSVSRAGSRPAVGAA